MSNKTAKPKERIKQYIHKGCGGGIVVCGDGAGNLFFICSECGHDWTPSIDGDQLNLRGMEKNEWRAVTSRDRYRNVNPKR